MAWMQLHNSDRMARFAKEIVGLFKSHFCVGGLLREYFSDDLSPLPADANTMDLAVEPGHLIEWSYLLKLYETLTGEATESVATMEAFSDAYGINPLNGLVMDHVHPNGQMVSAPQSRLWPQTEYIRLKLQSGTDKNLVDALKMMERLFANYFVFEGELTGYWRDQLSADGQDLINRAPASSFYHILGCLVPLL